MCPSSPCRIGPGFGPVGRFLLLAAVPHAVMHDLVEAISPEAVPDAVGERAFAQRPARVRSVSMIGNGGQGGPESLFFGSIPRHRGLIRPGDGQEIRCPGTFRSATLFPHSVADPSPPGGFGGHTRWDHAR